MEEDMKFDKSRKQRTFIKGKYQSGNYLKITKNCIQCSARVTVYRHEKIKAENRERIDKEWDRKRIRNG